MAVASKLDVSMEDGSSLSLLVCLTAPPFMVSVTRPLGFQRHSRSANVAGGIIQSHAPPRCLLFAESGRAIR